VSEETDRRGQILEAAFEEFATHGFHGATIKSIARAARLQSQALIYWYFPTKEALFQAVLEGHAPFLKMVLDPTTLLNHPPEEVLPMVAHAFLTTTERPRWQRLVRLVVGEMVRRPDVADLVGTKIMGRVLGFLTTYLTHQIEVGRLRPHDVRSSARAFIGMLAPQALGIILIPALLEGGPTNEQHITTAVAIFLNGLSTGEGG